MPGELSQHGGQEDAEEEWHWLASPSYLDSFMLYFIIVILVFIFVLFLLLLVYFTFYLCECYGTFIVVHYYLFGIFFYFQGLFCIFGISIKKIIVIALRPTSGHKQNKNLFATACSCKIWRESHLAHSFWQIILWTPMHIARCSQLIKLHNSD